MVDVAADSDFAVLRILDTGEEIAHWTSYTFDTEFLTPTDAMSFVTADEDAALEIAAKLLPGTRVQLEVNDAVQATMIVDGVKAAKSRNGGTVLTVEGRDAMGRLVDATVDPLFVFAAGMTLADLFGKLATPFGFTTFFSTDEARKAVVAKAPPPPPEPAADFPSTTETDFAKDPTTGAAEPSGALTIPAYKVVGAGGGIRGDGFTIQQAKPHEGEGVFAFLGRHCKRFGLWLWPNEAGDGIIVGRPNYDQAPLYSITNRFGDGASYLTASYERTAKEQPSLVIATGHGSGGAFDHASLKAAAINELIALDADGAIVDEVASILALHRGCKLAPIRANIRRYTTLAGWRRRRGHFAMFLHDDESKTPGQLEKFVVRELGERQAHAVTLAVRVEGHSSGGHPWTVNTTVSVDDDALNVHDTFWIRQVTFTKSREGTFTDLKLLPLNVLRVG